MSSEVFIGRHDFTTPRVSFLHDRQLNRIRQATESPALTSRTLAIQLYVATEGRLILFPGAIDTTDTPTYASFQADSSLRDTNGRSRAHDAGFGELCFYSDDSRLDATSLIIAIKKAMHARDAIREAVVSVRLCAENRIGVFSPVGFLCERYGGRLSYLTDFDNSVTTLDEVLWQPYKSEKDIETAISRAAINLATIHSMRIVHGDAQAKNLGWDNKLDRPHLVDGETARLYGPDKNEGTFYTGKIGDIERLFTVHPYTMDHDQRQLFAKTYASETKILTPQITQDDIMALAQDNN